MDKENPIVKLKDVARYAGVSIATVSIVLNMPDSKRVSAATKMRVLEAVQVLRYQPARYAQQMRGKNSAVLGLIIPDLMNQFYPEVTCGFSNTANEQGYNVVLLNSGNKIEREEFFAETLIGMRVSGVAICGVNLSGESEISREKELIKRLMLEHIPVVRLDRYDDDGICPHVGVDNFQASFFLTEQLIKDGHREIALFTSDAALYIHKERCRGYLEAMQKHQLQSCIYQTDQTGFCDIAEKMQMLRARDQAITALFNAASDMGAIECIKVATALGLRVPDDLSIAGFDDIYLANIVNPSLTTICQPKYEIGRTAMQLLGQMIDKEELAERNVLLPFSFVKRDSTRMHRPSIK